jgi:hypothetical protein
MKGTELSNSGHEWDTSATESDNTVHETDFLPANGDGPLTKCEIRLDETERPRRFSGKAVLESAGSLTFDGPLPFTSGSAAEFAANCPQISLHRQDLR